VDACSSCRGELMGGKRSLQHVPECTLCSFKAAFHVLSFCWTSSHIILKHSLQHRSTAVPLLLSLPTLWVGASNSVRLRPTAESTPHNAHKQSTTQTGPGQPLPCCPPCAAAVRLLQCCSRTLGAEGQGMLLELVLVLAQVRGRLGHSRSCALFRLPWSC